MPDRDKAEVGDTVKAIWFDDPTWYEGQVKQDEEGLFIDIEGDIIGYLKNAFEVQLISRECEFGGDTANDCDGCAYSEDYHYNPKTGACERREKTV